jgi:hypothetical protein
MHGFWGDSDPMNYTVEDYERSLKDFAVSLAADFITSLAILRMIYAKNHDITKAIRQKKNKDQNLSRLLTDST